MDRSAVLTQAAPTTRSRVAWSMYDWANSAFSQVIETFVFAAYFAHQIAPDPDTGSALWGFTIGAAGFVVAAAGPVLGAIADQAGRRKPWIGSLTALTVVATAMLWLVEPGSPVTFPLVLVGLGVIGVEGAGIFYNAMLPTLAAPHRIGRWSGWAWALGYLGGITCLVIALFGFVLNSNPPFGLDPSRAEHVRATFVLAAAWFAIFALPLFLFTPDQRGTGRGIREMIRGTGRQLVQSVRQVRAYANVVRFLIARMLFADGLNTVLAMGGVFAAAAFGMDAEQIIRFGILTGLTAGIGAAGFAWIDDWIGPRRTILLSLLGLLTCLAAILFTFDQRWFWVLGATLGVFVGPIQAASRSFMARAAPPELRTQFFGLFALSGKATAFVGPTLVGLVTALTGSTRAGMSVVLVLLVAGLGLMLTVKEESAAPAPSASAADR